MFVYMEASADASNVDEKPHVCVRRSVRGFLGFGSGWCIYV